MKKRYLHTANGTHGKRHGGALDKRELTDRVHFVSNSCPSPMDANPNFFFVISKFIFGFAATKKPGKE